MRSFYQQETEEQPYERPGMLTPAEARALARMVAFVLALLVLAFVTACRDPAAPAEPCTWRYAPITWAAPDGTTVRDSVRVCDWAAKT